MTTGNRGNGSNGGGRGPADDDSSAGGVGENDDTSGTGGDPPARLARAARVVFVHTIDHGTAGFGGATATNPDHNPAPEGATGLAGANLQSH
ncbi:hypothetical protein [Nannocystis pusilla]|uniref:hypothetical protein n=1 Tax=Nannocystis pusilla TaxID=889268 RepID=UPI003B7A04D7